MRKKLLRILPVVIALVAIFAFSVPAMAATTATVTVTAQPAFIAISIVQNTWTINGIVNDGYIEPDTVYYSNPQGDTTALTATVAANEGYFDVTNTSSVDIDLTVDMGNFTGGTDNMTNSDLGSNDTTKYGAYSYYEGCTYADDKVIVQTTASDVLWTSSSPGDDIDLGVVLETQSNAWTAGDSSTATITITAARHT